MISSVYNIEFNQDEITDNFVTPLIERKESYLGTKSAKAVFLKDKLEHDFFILIIDKEYIVDLNAFTIDKFDNNFVLRAIGSLQAQQFNQIINGEEVETYYISSLFAKPRNQHIGLNLLQTFVDFARQQNVDYITLTSLPKSLKFYKRFGFSTFINGLGEVNPKNLCFNTNELLYDHEPSLTDNEDIKSR